MDDDTIDPLALSRAAEQTTELLRQLRPEDVTCEAGELTGESGVLCKIEEGVIEARTSPSSLMAYCCSDYLACPTWKKSKEAEWGIGVALVDLRADAAEKRKMDARRKDAKRERMERSAELLRSPSKEGAEFRERLFRIIREAEARTT
jgi:hypothetical protein